jgi:hypothetical protein
MMGARIAGVSLIVLVGATLPVHAQISKGQQIVLNHGLQLQGVVITGDIFTLSTYSNASFTSVAWMGRSTPSLMGTAPGYAWSRWISSETDVPGAPAWPEETPYLPQLISMQLGDEWDLNNDIVRARAVAWFNSIRTNWPNTILYGNNWGGQIQPGPLQDYITNAGPDMLCFDTYLFQSQWDSNLPDHIGPPIGWQMHDSLLKRWYGDLAQYRTLALGASVPLAIYRQIFHSVQDYNTTVFRDPSPSELRLNTAAALAFNAKWLNSFIYNTGNSSLFYFPGGDTYPTPLYAEMADANRRALNLGKALVCLKPVYELHNTNDVSPPPGPGSDNPYFQDGWITSIMFLRGRYLSGGVTNWTDVPGSFSNDPEGDVLGSVANPNYVNYTWWEAKKNDPYSAGWALTNKAGVVNSGLPGDVIMAWFRPLDESFDGPNYTNELYFMVVNALTATNGTAADCMQEITLKFLAAAPSSVVMLDPETGLLHTNTMAIIPNSGGRHQLVLDLNGGDAALFKFNDGAPFVGFIPPAQPQLGINLLSGKPCINLSQLTPGARYRVQCSPLLANSTWSTLTDLLLTNSTCRFLDLTTSNGAFYRAVGIP